MKIIFKALVILMSCTVLLACGSRKKNKSNYMQRTFKELQAQLPDATVTILNDSIKVLFPENIMFATNSAELTPLFEPKVKQFATVLNKYNKTSILVNGYTDNTGSKETNDALSNNRASNARTALLKNEVPEKRVYAWGHGSNDPIATNNTPEGRQKNRRVEFIVLFDVN